MSRVSLNRRLQAIREATERIFPLAMKIHCLPPAWRMSYERWRSECERELDALESRDGPGGAYAAIIDGSLVLPEPPQRVAAALGITRPCPIPATATANELSNRYASMIDQ